MKTLTYSAVQASQSPNHKVLTFAAKASDVLKFASIDRTRRNAQGDLSGFQRPQIAGHIREIKDYLQHDDAVLPNPIVVAFTTGVSIQSMGKGIASLKINLTKGAPGLVVDGQQRLTALSQITNKDFEVFVSALICSDEAELRRQFVLINNTRPLPKSLIYELLPGVEGLPHRLSNRRSRSSRTPGSKCRSMKSARPSKTPSKLGATRPNRAFMTEGFSKRPWAYQPITGPACQPMGSWSSPCMRRRWPSMA